MTKIGIITDVHGDLPGLKRALRTLHDKGAERVICSGDLVDRGPDGEGVVQFFIKHNIPCVQGNHDHSRPAQDDWYRREGRKYPFMKYDPVSQSTIDYLTNLPHWHTFHWDGVNIYMTHASPWSQTSYIFPNTVPDNVRRVATEAHADVVILGHTHTPMRLYESVSGTHILNSGSVYGIYPDGRHQTCAVLTLPQITFEVYDINTGEDIPTPTVKF